MRMPAMAWMALGAVLLMPQWSAAQLSFSSSYSKNSTTSSTTLKATSGSTLFSSGSKTTTATTGNQTATGDGPMLGQEWHIQREHDRGSVVGANAREGGFVGSEQAAQVGAVVSAVNGLRVLVGNVNVPLPVRRRTEMYEPHVALGFTVTGPAPQAVETAIADRIQASPAFHLSLPIAVSLEGSTATLRGEVASESEKALIEQRVLFEPGIYSVRNLLTVKTPEPAPKAKPNP